jgi:hypothetical protein
MSSEAVLEVAIAGFPSGKASSSPTVSDSDSSGSFQTVVDEVLELKKLCGWLLFPVQWVLLSS